MPAMTLQFSKAISQAIRQSLGTDDLAVAAISMTLHKSGATPEAIYTGLLTPVARRLGEMWENDECTFADVSMGVLQLQNAWRALSPMFRGPHRVSERAPRVLLMPVPGEQHTFGLTIVADYFARAGWDTWTGLVESAGRAVEIVRNERVDMVGLSLACNERIETTTRLISAFRRRALNPRMGVIVGGPLLVADPGMAARVGADLTAVDGQQAVLRANEFYQGSP